MAQTTKSSFAQTYVLAATTAFDAETDGPRKGTGKGDQLFADGFIAGADGDVVYQGPGDTSNKTWPCVAGGHYPIRIKSIDATSAISILLGWID